MSQYWSNPPLIISGNVGLFLCVEEIVVRFAVYGYLEVEGGRPLLVDPVPVLNFFISREEEGVGVEIGVVFIGLLVLPFLPVHVLLESNPVRTDVEADADIPHPIGVYGWLGVIEEHP